jgi:hypothetical protein
MKKGYDLPHHVAEAVKREAGGMQVHWAGRPDARVAFWCALPIWLFAIPWTAFALFWEAAAVGALWSTASDGMPSALRVGFGIVFPLFGLPFVAIGLAMLGSPFWIARRVQNQAFAVTGDRLLAIHATRSGGIHVTSALVRKVCKIERTEMPDGSGTLKIVTGTRKDSDGDNVESAETWTGIPDVRHVETLIYDLQSRVVPQA